MYGFLIFVWSILLLTAVNGQSHPPMIGPNLTQYFAVYENATIGTSMFVLRARDLDPDNTLSFSVATPDTSTLVRLGSTTFSPATNQWTCPVFLNSDLDRDNSPISRQLYFTLTDGQSVVPLRIFMIINDVNDNPPTFTGLPYRTSVREDLAVGSSIFTVTASDPDLNNGGSVLFSMKAVVADDNSMFLLDPEHGHVTLSRRLDYERQSFYHYNVSAMDRGEPPCPGISCQCKGAADVCDPGPVDLFITIMDVQDTPPVFERLPYMGRVPEDTHVGTSILSVTARDGDRGVGQPNQVVFTFTQGDFSCFTINETSGVISVASELDVDSQLVRDKGGLYVFTVTATELPQEGSVPSPNPNNSSSTQVSITVTDVNDNPPTFSVQNVTATVLENTPAGVPITTVSVVEVYDLDQAVNSRFRVYLEKDGWPYRDFDTLPRNHTLVQGRSTVTISVVNSSVLDYETTKSLTFKLVAREDHPDSNVSSSSEVTVTLEVKDVNDNNPYFPSQPTIFNVSEDALPGHVIANILAEDLDSGEFGHIVFSLEDSGSNGKFNISQTGQVVVAAPLDREEQPTFILTVAAADNPSAPIDQRRKTTLRLLVHVTDVNDHAPVWSQYLPYVSVLESSSVGAKVAQVRALDWDQGLNAQVVYSILPETNGSHLFDVAVQDDSVSIVVRASLLDQVGLFLVQVLASDRGAPPLNSTLSMSVFVIDENQNRPIFVSPSQAQFELNTTLPPEIHVYEEQPIGSILFTLSAEDKDSDQNGQVEYFLNPTSNKDFEFFTVSRLNGSILSARRLDRESKPFYEIQVRAEDNGQPAQLSSVLPLVIRLLDINDNGPSFQHLQMPQILHVTEEMSPAPAGRIQPAHDDDEQPFNQSCYFLYGSNDSGFSLNKLTGDLVLTTKVDRETTPILYGVIKAVDNCTLPEDNFLNSHSLGLQLNYAGSPWIGLNSSDESLMWVEVMVDDINDNPPQFTDHEFSTSILYDVDIGTEILALRSSVTDQDTPSHSQNLFQLLSIVPVLDVGDSLDTTKPPFVVSNNGTVATNIRFRSDLLGYFLVRVMVYDQAGMSDTANIRVYLISNLQRIRLVFTKLPNQVEELKNSFVRKLSEILEIDIVMDKIQSHSLADGTRDPSKTDAYIHGRYRDTGLVVAASDLWQMLDLSHQSRSLLFGDGVVEAKPLAKETSENDRQEQTRTFIILTAVLSVLVVALVAVLVRVIRQYRLRLRAATTFHEPTKEKAFIDHPGTNKFVVAVNPLFGKDMKHMAVEEDKNSHNSLDVNEVDKQPPPATHNQLLDKKEEQEMTLNITDYYDVMPILDAGSHSTHLDHVLQVYRSPHTHLEQVLQVYSSSNTHLEQGYSNSGFQYHPENDIDHEDDSGGRDTIGPYSDSLDSTGSSFVPGLGAHVVEGVTRFADGDRPSSVVSREMLQQRREFQHTEI